MANAIGQRVARYRKQRELTVQQMSDALAELGVILKRPVLSNLENGYRRTVTVAEVLAIARVLGVPPLLLVAPVGTDEKIEILPGVKIDTWSAARWFTGEAPFPGDSVLAQRSNLDALALYRHHERLVDEWHSQVVRSGSATTIPDDAVSAALGADIARRQSIEQSIRLIRGLMRREGLIVPELAPHLERLDDEARP